MLPTRARGVPFCSLQRDLGGQRTPPPPFSLPSPAHPTAVPESARCASGGASRPRSHRRNSPLPAASLWRSCGRCCRRGAALGRHSRWAEPQEEPNSRTLGLREAPGAGAWTGQGSLAPGLAAAQQAEPAPSPPRCPLPSCPGDALTWPSARLPRPRFPGPAQPQGSQQGLGCRTALPLPPLREPFPRTPPEPGTRGSWAIRPPGGAAAIAPALPPRRPGGILGGPATAPAPGGAAAACQGRGLAQRGEAGKGRAKRQGLLQSQRRGRPRVSKAASA